MKRTQIYLPQWQLTALKERAYKETATVSEVIRSILEERLQPRRTRRMPHHETLMASARRIGILAKKKAPSDLASRVDHYLYGGK